MDIHSSRPQRLRQQERPLCATRYRRGIVTRDEQDAHGVKKSGGSGLTRTKDAVCRLDEVAGSRPEVRVDLLLWVNVAVVWRQAEWLQDRATRVLIIFAKLMDAH